MKAETPMRTIKRSELQQGGFQGVCEHRFVMSPKLYAGRQEPGVSSGIGDFVYLADAEFRPHGETGMHGHKEIDVISVMAKGRIAHQGSLEHGQELSGHDVQVQRAGAEGFQHNELNPDDETNRMIQLWCLPETKGECAGYKLYAPEQGQTQRIYGGARDQSNTYASKTLIDVATLLPGQILELAGEFIAFVVTGDGKANAQATSDSTLVEGVDLRFEARADTQLLLIHASGEEPRVSN